MSVFHDFSSLDTDGPRLTGRQAQILELIPTGDRPHRRASHPG